MAVCLLHLGPSEAWAQFDPDTGHLLREGEGAPPAGEPVWVVVPGAAVVTRYVALPPQVNARAHAAAAFLLEDDLAADGDTLHFALDTANTQTRMVAVTARTQMDLWRTRLAELGVKPTVITPDYLALPPGAVRACDGMVLARSAEGGFTVESELVSWVSDGLRAEPVSRAAMLREMFATLRQGASINLLQGAYAPRRDWAALGKQWRRAGELAAAVLALAVVGQLAEAWQYNRRADAAAARAEVILRRALPDVKRVVNPVAQMRARLLEARAADSSGFLQMSNILFGAVSAVEGVEVESLRFDGRRGEISFTMALPSFDALEKVKAEIVRQGGAVQEGGARQEAQRIYADMTLRLL